MGVRIIPWLVSSLTKLDSSASLHTNNNIFSSCVKSKLVKLETRRTVILPPTARVVWPLLCIKMDHRYDDDTLIERFQNCLKWCSLIFFPLFTSSIKILTNQSMRSKFFWIQNFISKFVQIRSEQKWNTQIWWWSLKHQNWGKWKLILLMLYKLLLSFVKNIRIS